MRIPVPEGETGRAIISKYIQSEKWELDFINDTAELASIREYTGLSFREIIKLPIGELLLYRKDAWIAKMRKNEQGREFLKTLWRLQQTEPDTQAIEKYSAERGGQQ